MPGRRVATAAIVLLGALVLPACAGPPEPPGPTESTTTRTVTHRATPDPTPVAAGPTTSATGTCRLLDRDRVAHAVGMRLAKVTVQRSGGHLVGCRYYGLQHPNPQCDAACLAKERLPPADQPAVRISLLRYGSSTAAHNAMVLTAEAGTNAQPVKVRAGNVGLAYQTRFYPKDRGRDWACAFTVGRTLAVIETVTTKTSYNAVAVARQLDATLG